MRQLVLPAVLLGLATCAQAEPRVLEQGALAPGAAREGEVQPGTRHAWMLAVTQGEVYELRVEQLGQNLVLTVDPGDGAQRRVDDRRGWSGGESVRFVAPRSGTASLRIRPATDRAGRYRVQALDRGPAADQDRRRDEAELLMARGAEADEPASWRAAAQAFLALHLPEREVVALFKLSAAAANSAEPDLIAEARTSAERCLGLAEQLDDDDARAECLYSRAGALWVAGQTGEAKGPYLASAEVYERRGETGPMAVVLNTLAGLAYSSGELEQAQALSERAGPLLEQDGNHLQLATVENRLASILGSRGRYSDSLARFERAAEEGARAASSAELQARGNIGIVYGQLGDPERSLAHLRSVLALASRQPLGGDAAFIGWIHAAMAGAHEDLADDEAAAAEYGRALELAEGAAAWQGLVAEASAHLGTLEARRGNTAASERLFERSLAEARAFGDQTRVARTELEQARARVHGGRLDEASGPLERAMQTFVRLGLVEYEAHAWSVRAELLRARDELPRALECVTEALARIESLRARVTLLEQRAQYLGARREVYDLAIGLLLEMHRREPAAGHLARAFEMSERARARTLLDEDTREPEPAERARAPELVSRRRAAFERIARLQKELVAQHTAALPDVQALARLAGELDAAVEQEQSARHGLRAQDARRLELLDPQLVSAQTAAAALAPDETLVEYYVGREASWVFALDRGGLRVAPLPSEKGLRELVAALRTPLAQPSLFGAAAYAASARKAFEVLLAPVLARPGVARRLRIAPDGPLWELPFEALVSDDTGSRWADLAYLVRRCTVTYVPSASVAALPRRAAKNAGGPLLVAFANPRVPKGAVEGPAAAAVQRAALGEGERWSLPPLPCAEREARGVGRLLGSARSKVFTGADARESRAKRDADVAHARYLLFATHGVVSERLPAQSGLVLSLSGDAPEDGLLQSHEIAELELEARLVVLSACDSALGRNVKGEGLLGLARAFLQAGAGGLVASLWRVDDCSTAEIVQALFRRLEARTGPQPPATALREAKLELLRGRTWAHPYYWAPFVLLGAEAR